MKVSYRNYPILKKLHDKKLGLLPIFEKDKPFMDFAMMGFKRNWEFYTDKFLSEINIISKPFVEASYLASNKLMELWKDIAINDSGDLDCSGTFVCDKWVYMVDYHVRKGSDDNELVFFMFDNTGIPLALYIDSDKYSIHSNIWISSCFSVTKNDKDILTWVQSQFWKILLYRLFKTYAEVETVELKGHSKKRNILCKYVNDTDIDVTFLDSKWFTTLIKSEAFNVRGHFRLQPFGEGMKKRKLIWISEFEKTGYTAPARKLAVCI